MKKRKIKLFASVASLALVAAVATVGVFAATTQAAKVTSTVTFTATGIKGDVKLLVSSANTGENLESTLISAAAAGTTTTLTETAYKVWECTNAEADNTVLNDVTATEIALTFDDANSDGYIYNGNTFVYTFTINNTGVKTMYYKVTTSGTSTLTNVAVTGGDNNDGTGSIAASGAAEQVIVTYTIKGGDKLDNAAYSSITAGTIQGINIELSLQDITA